MKIVNGYLKYYGLFMDKLSEIGEILEPLEYLVENADVDEPSGTVKLTLIKRIGTDTENYGILFKKITLDSVEYESSGEELSSILREKIKDNELLQTITY